MKKVRENLYVHKSNLSELYCALPKYEIPPIQPIFTWAYDHDFPFEVVKYNLIQKTISLINAEGWNERFEPIVGDSVMYDQYKKTFKTKKGGFQVYHMKEVFVHPDYRGFYVEEAKQRTELLNSLEIIRKSKSKMGFLKWWDNFLKEYNLPVYMTKPCEFPLV